jgi:hypothetical protein
MPARKTRRARKSNAAEGTAAAPPSASTARTPRKQTPGMIAAHERMKKCGAEWKEAKAAGKVTKGMKWPQYWSACNKRLKASGT